MINYNPHYNINWNFIDDVRKNDGLTVHGWKLFKIRGSNGEHYNLSWTILDEIKLDFVAENVLKQVAVLKK